MSPLTDTTNLDPKTNTTNLDPNSFKILSTNFGWMHYPASEAVAIVPDKKTNSYLVKFACGDDVVYPSDKLIHNCSHFEQLGQY